jgi:hypothetical protein
MGFVKSCKISSRKPSPAQALGTRELLMSLTA